MPPAERLESGAPPGGDRSPRATLDRNPGASREVGGQASLPFIPVAAALTDVSLVPPSPSPLYLCFPPPVPPSTVVTAPDPSHPLPCLCLSFPSLSIRRPPPSLLLSTLRFASLHTALLPGKNSGDSGQARPAARWSLSRQGGPAGLARGVRLSSPERQGQEGFLLGAGFASSVCPAPSPTPKSLKRPVGKQEQTRPHTASAPSEPQRERAVSQAKPRPSSP